MMRRILIALCAAISLSLSAQLYAESLSTAVRTYDDMIAAGALNVAV